MKLAWPQRLERVVGVAERPKGRGRGRVRGVVIRVDSLEMIDLRGDEEVEVCLELDRRCGHELTLSRGVGGDWGKKDLGRAGKDRSRVRPRHVMMLMRAGCGEVRGATWEAGRRTARWRLPYDPDLFIHLQQLQVSTVSDG